MLVNLLTSASKYQHQGEIKVSAYLREDSVGDFLLELVVLDQGMGMNQDEVEDIFEAIVREVRPQSSNLNPASRIALSISKRIC